jgi:hypothetical protein
MRTLIVSLPIRGPVFRPADVKTQLLSEKIDP